MTYQEQRWRSADGRLELFARDYPGEGPALLLMHGLTRNSADFEPLAAHLAGKYRLIVPDQRGRGLSRWDDIPANYRFDVYAADMFALLDVLGVERAGMIGTSMGGLISMVMAATAPTRVSGLVLNDVGAEVDPVGLARIQGYAGTVGAFASWDEAAQATRAINGDAFPDYAQDDWLAFARRACTERDGKIIFNYDPAIATTTSSDDTGAVPADLWPLWDMLSPIPALVIRGQNSDILSRATIDAMQRRHSGPFSLAEVTNRAHAPMLDEPEAVAAIELFLSDYID